jgi:hypothetical protein
MATNETDSAVPVSASEFRAHLFEHLGAAAAGRIVRVHYKGTQYQLVALKPAGKLDRFYTSGPAEPVIAAGDKSFSDDPKLKSEREKKWIAKWDRRLKHK